MRLKWLKITHFLFGKLQTRGRSNLRNDMKQAINLKSLGFTQEKIAKLLEGFPEAILCDIDLSGFFDVTFDLRISSIVLFVVDHVAKLVLFVYTSCRSR